MWHLTSAGSSQAFRLEDAQQPAVKKTRSYGRSPRPETGTIMKLPPVEGSSTDAKSPSNAPSAVQHSTMLPSPGRRHSSCSPPTNA